jgi:DUF2917 family protein
MKAELSRSTWNMNTGEFVSLAGARDWTLTLESGRAWLTLEGYSQDKWLHPGERFRLPGTGLLLIEADRASRLGLEPPAAAPSGIGIRALQYAAAHLLATLRGLTLHAPERQRCPGAY